MISKEERAELRNFCQMALGRGCPLPNRDIREIPKLTLKTLDALEAAEARAEAAERERDALLGVAVHVECHHCPLMSDECPTGCGKLSGENKQRFIEWARQQARGGEDA